MADGDPHHPERVEASVNPEQAKKLREPFPREAIGKLPRLNCRACQNAQGKACPEHPKRKCQQCGNYLSPAHIHLDYVGHAATTDRLLQVDPEWTWEPMAFGPNGEPLVTNGGLWIRLTVAGVTRPGFGDAEGGKGMKEIIGDAIRNAAMRFGVALDLWAKEDLSGAHDDAPAKAAGDKPEPEPYPADGNVVSEAQVKRLWAIVRERGVPDDDFRRIVGEVTGVESTKQIPKGLYDAVVVAVQVWEPSSEQAGADAQVQMPTGARTEEP